MFMSNDVRRRNHLHGSIGLLVLALGGIAAPARADEVWVAPTNQQDLGGLGIGSNVVWPVTPAGAVRLAWGVPNDLQTFQSAKVVLIPHSPGGAATLNVIICPAQQAGAATGGCAGPFAHAFTGVANQLLEVDVSAVVAPRVGAAGLNYLAVLAYTTPTTATDHIVGLRFAYAPAAPPGVATLAANTFTGTQTAPAFVGDGSGLTNLPVPSGVATLGANTFSGTQTAPAFAGNGAGLTNLPFPAGAATLGPNSFTGTQTINAGNLDLANSTATTGYITKEGVPFLHTFGSLTNTFLGLEAGNFTMTSLGVRNTAIGAVAFDNNTDGHDNVATGTLTLFQNTTGFQNTATGAGALGTNSEGNNNTANGTGAFLNNSTGSDNVAIGFMAGSNATTGSNNIYLGANVGGVAGESNAMYLGLPGTQTKTIIAGVRGTAVNSGEMVVVDPSGRLGSAPVGAPGANTVGSSEVIDGSLTANDLAADSVTASKVAFNYAGSASEGGPATNLACAGCVDATEVSFSFVGTGANTFTGTQTINGGNLDLDDGAGLVSLNGIRFLHNFGTQNTFLGWNVGNFSMTGGDNTAVGRLAFFLNTTGHSNSALGLQALQSNSTGSNNTAIGLNALLSNTTGNFNTASGSLALAFNDGGISNTASGHSALLSNTTGAMNVATGDNALSSNTIGVGNVAVGAFAGADATTGSHNIYLGAEVRGIAEESNTIYLGQQGRQTKTLIAGIRGTTVTGGDMVVIDAEGRLGSAPVGAPGANTIGSAEVIDGSLTAGDFASDSVTESKVAFNYAASSSEGGPATNLACAGCVDATEVSFSFVGTGANTFTGTQTIDGGNLDLDNEAGLISLNGMPFLHNFGTQNTFLGWNVGNFWMTGGDNTAIGWQAFLFNSTGRSNTAVGFQALQRNSEGISNTAIGLNALLNNTTGSENTASGFQALVYNNEGHRNTASGYSALTSNTAGSHNVASGYSALFNNTTGASNVAVGFQAGYYATTGSHNIYLGAHVNGVADESNTMYLGGQGIQTRTFIAGVAGTTTDIEDAVPVMIDSAGQLGTVVSSRRYKEDIQKMGDVSRRLLRLRPVTFRYTQAYRNGTRPVQFGLIAEEVAEVFPELVVRNGKGEPETVHYELLNVLLLNELQNQQDLQQRERQQQQQRIEALELRLNELMSRLDPSAPAGR